jgi:ElaB/YqjD/DUF883 family membrane-anchored ribosome-binding protein
MANTVFGTTGRNLANDAEALRDDAADVVSEATDAAADIASRVQDRASAIGKKAVDQFNATAGYLREHEIKEMADDLNSWVKSHPTQALIAAAALGFVAAALLRRR